MEIAIQYFDGCPSWVSAREKLMAAATALDLDAEVRLVRVETDEEARELGFRGSPSFIVEGRDLFPTEDTPIGMSCRVYTVGGKGEGSPSLEQLREALRPFAPG